MKNLNIEIINRVIDHLDNKKNAVNYLMTLLGIGKESAYRRINNTIPFTFQEVITIANDLNFSIDKILDKDVETRVSFDMPVNINQDPDRIFIEKLEQGNLVLEKLANSKKLNIIAAINRIPFFLFPFETLFKFEYCLYLNSIGHMHLMTTFSDVEITPQIKELHEKSAHYFSQLRNVTCVVDHNFLYEIIQEILYFHHLKFISDEELRILQKELLDLFALCEIILRTGQNQFGCDYSIYYSHFNIESNCIYYEYDNESMIQLWIYPESPIIIKNNTLMSDIQKRWLDAIIRRSMPISKTNNILQIGKFEETYNQILGLTQNLTDI